MDLILDKYSNILTMIDINLGQAEAQIEDFYFQYIVAHEPKIEHMHFPPFLLPFFHHILMTGNIPSQSEFWGMYLGMNIGTIREERLNFEAILGLKARVFRTYTALLREFHLCMMVRHGIPEVNCHYSMNLDLSHDIDMLVETDHGYYALCMFIDTPESNHWRKIKEGRHERFTNVEYIELPFNPKTAKKVGRYNLYPPETIDWLRNKMDIRTAA